MATDQKASPYLRKHGPARDYELLSEAQAKRIEALESHLRGICNNWYEFGEMMLRNKTDYGLDERISHAYDFLNRDQ